MEIISNQFVLYGLGKCSETIDSVIAELNIPYGSDTCFEIRLMLTEALTNAFKHGNKGCADKPIYFRYSFNGINIRFVIEDSGDGFENKLVSKLILDEYLLHDHGRGLFLINSIADKIDLSGNIMVIEKNLSKGKQ